MSPLHRLKWLRYISGKPISSSAKSVAMLLADSINASSGDAWPAVGTMAQELSTDRRTIQRAIKQLKELKLITVKTRYDSSNIYTLVLPEGAAIPPQGGAAKLPQGGRQSCRLGGGNSAALTEEKNKRKEQERTEPQDCPIPDPIVQGLLAMGHSPADITSGYSYSPELFASMDTIEEASEACKPF